MFTKMAHFELGKIVILTLVVGEGVPQAEEHSHRRERMLKTSLFAVDVRL